MRKYLYLYYEGVALKAIATHRIDKFGCACKEYRNVTPSSQCRFENLASKPYTIVDSWDIADFRTVEMEAEVWRLPERNDLKFGTVSTTVSSHVSTVIRVVSVRIDRQGNRSATISRVVEGEGFHVAELFDNITFSSFIRIMELTLTYPYYIMPAKSSVTIVVQHESPLVSTW